MFKIFIQKFFVFAVLAIFFSASLFGLDYTADIQQSPLILSNHDNTSNSLEGSVHELLNRAETAILMISFTFSEPDLIRILNEKAVEGVEVKVMIDRAHIGGLRALLHPTIEISTRGEGEGHLHHKILVVDRALISVSSGNFTASSFRNLKNVAIAFFSPELAHEIYQEALAIASSGARLASGPFTCRYQDQLLELYLLPHNEPVTSRPVETSMNELAKQKLIHLIDQAKHHIKISVALWTCKDASRAILSAKQRGVQVDITTGDLTGDAVKMMIDQGIHVMQGRQLHHKFMLVDDKILLNGSPNWSMNAFSRSDESFIVLYDITEKQLKDLEGALKAAGLTTSLYFNSIEIPLPTEDVSEKIEKINKTIIALNAEMSKQVTSKERARLIAIAKRLSSDLMKFIPHIRNSPVPGCCLYEGEHYLENVVAIAEKQEKVEAAVQYIKRMDDVEQKVSDFFHKTLKKLQAGINAPLPDYFHATSSGFQGILESKTILQSRTGVTGPGTYMSCNNEGDHGYGEYAFAIDEGCLVDTVAKFRTGRHPATNVFFSLWASVLKDIPVTQENIAFIDTTEDVGFVQALLKQNHLDIEVLERKTSEKILRIFDLTTKRRELPSFDWNKFVPQDYLPKNMYPRSPQGTYHPFGFSAA